MGNFANKTFIGEIEITKETWQKIASMLASLIVLDCEKKR